MASHQGGQALGARVLGLELEQALEPGYHAQNAIWYGGLTAIAVMASIQGHLTTLLLSQNYHLIHHLYPTTPSTGTAPPSASCATISSRTGHPSSGTESGP